MAGQRERSLLLLPCLLLIGFLLVPGDTAALVLSNEPTADNGQRLQTSHEEPVFLETHEDYHPDPVLVKRQVDAADVDELPDFIGCPPPATLKLTRNSLWSYCAALGFRRRKDANTKCMKVIARVLRTCGQESQEPLTAEK